MIKMFYEKTEQFIKDTLGDIGRTKHLLRTVYRLKILKPDADEVLCISAVAHDIWRRDKSYNTDEKIKQSKNGFLDKEFLTKHQNESAKVTGEFLESIGADQHMIQRVKMLISKHERGGNTDQNLLKDADSISFLENQIDNFMGKVNSMGKDKVREKIDWTFERITSNKAKEIARVRYEEAIKRLDESKDKF